MWFNYLREKFISNACRFGVLILIALVALPAFSQGNQGSSLPSISTQVTSLNAESVLTNIAQQMPNLMRMVTAFAYVMGMYFIFAGVMKLKHFGESRTMMSQEHSLAGPIAYIAVGAMLLYLPTSVNVGMSTFWTNPNPYGYAQQADQWTQVINDCFLVIQFIGTIAFIRGLVLLSHMGGSGQQQSFAKGITHIIGGILCINIYQFVQVILMTIGIQT